MKHPDITIFIPTFRRPLTLPKAIESALNQTWKNLKVLISDNASGDETPEIVRMIAARDSRVQYICQPENKGMLGNYEFGMSAIDTPYFSILSDDDYLYPCFCEIAMRGFSQHPESIFSAGSTVCLGKDKNILGVTLDAWPREGRYDPPQGLVTMCHQIPPPNTILFRREAAAAAPLNRQNFAWDVEFLLTLAAKFPFVISKTPCGVFVNHEGSYSNNSSIVDSLEITQKLIIKMKTFPSLDDEVKSKVEVLLRLSIYKYTFNSILKDCQDKKTSRAKQNAKALLSFYPLNFTTLPYTFSVCICLAFPFAYRLFFTLKNLKKRYRKIIMQLFHNRL